MHIRINRVMLEEASDYSCSTAERGSYAGAGSYAAAVRDAMSLLPASNAVLNIHVSTVTESEFDAHIVEWLKPWGGWTDEEIQDMGLEGRRALLLQFISGDLREAGLDEDRPEEISTETWDAYQTMAEAGQCQGSIWRDESGVYWFSLEH
jgi:hypothetical protein